MIRGVGGARGGQRGDALHDRVAPWGTLWLATDDRTRSWLSGSALVAIRSCESAQAGYSSSDQRNIIKWDACLYRAAPLALSWVLEVIVNQNLVTESLLN